MTMSRPRNARRLRCWLWVAVALAFVSDRSTATARRDLPPLLTDREFWELMNALEEKPLADGYASDNLVSNEMLFSDVLPKLRQTVTPGSVFLGVGPEQNFSFVADLRPGIAFVVDLRRVNWHLHLMYKAAFEMSSDRADFLSRLFARRRPNALAQSATAAELFDAFENSPLENAAVERNALQLTNYLAKERRLPLSGADLEGIGRVYRAFCQYGFALDSASTLTYARELVGRSGPNFRDLMTQGTAGSGDLTYLGSEQRFVVVKDLHRRNLIVPVVGDFAGPTTLRAIGGFLRQRGAVMQVFYVSNVESYLRRDGVWDSFCTNVGSMPLAADSVFVRVRSTSFIYFPGGVAREIPPTFTELVPISKGIEPCRKP
jgi:hypothetical protein